MERNVHETTSRWKTYGKRLLSEDLEVRDENANPDPGLRYILEKSPKPHSFCKIA
jgi:hypothetical protein